MNQDKKRKEFLEKFEEKFQKHYRKYKNFEKYFGPGIKKKIQRLFYASDVYIPYIFWRIHLLPRKNRKIKLFWGKEIFTDLNSDDIFTFSQCGGIFYDNENDLTKFLIKNLKENDIFYDIGANYGFYTYLSLEFCKEVHSFEPISDLSKNLENNIKNDKKVFINHLALSNKEGECILFSPEGNDFSGSTIVLESTIAHKYKYDKQIKVQVTTIEKYLELHSAPTFIKMDIEGAESLVIEGGEDFFKNNSPVIAMEVWSKNNGGEISMKAVKKLRELGYQSYSIKKGDLEKIDGDLAEVVLAYGLSFYNFVFKK